MSAGGPRRTLRHTWPTARPTLYPTLDPTPPLASRAELIGGSGRTAGRYTTTARAFISPAAYVGPLPEPRAESASPCASPAGLLKGVSRHVAQRRHLTHLMKGLGPRARGRVRIGSQGAASSESAAGSGRLRGCGGVESAADSVVARSCGWPLGWPGALVWVVRGWDGFD